MILGIFARDFIKSGEKFFAKQLRQIRNNCDVHNDDKKDKRGHLSFLWYCPSCVQSLELLSLAAYTSPAILSTNTLRINRISVRSAYITFCKRLMHATTVIPKIAIKSPSR